MMERNHHSGDESSNERYDDRGYIIGGSSSDEDVYWGPSDDEVEQMENAGLTDAEIVFLMTDRYGDRYNMSGWRNDKGVFHSPLNPPEWDPVFVPASSIRSRERLERGMSEADDREADASRGDL